MSDQKHLHALTIYWQHPTPAVRLLFKTREKGEAVIEQLKANDRLRRTFVEDDYGNVMLIALDSVAGILLTDMVEEAEGNRALQLFTAHAQIRLQKAAEADPVIHEHQSRQARLAQIQGAGAQTFPFRQ